MKPIHKIFFFFIVLFLACGNPNKEGTDKETPKPNNRGKQIMVVSSPAIGQAMVGDSIIGLALDHEFVRPDKRDTIYFYKILKSLHPSSSRPTLSVEQFNPFEFDLPESSNRLGDISNTKMDNDSLNFEFRDRIENEKDTFDFAYFTKSQILPLLDRDSLVVYGAEINLGSTEGAIAKDKHFTFKLEKKGNRINPSFILAAFPLRIQVSSPPPFQIGIPCPPEWNPTFRSIKKAIEDSQ